MLHLVTPIATASADGVAGRVSFAGSPGFAVEYAEGAPAAPEWPLLRQGFFGRSSSGTGPSPLGIEVGAAHLGGPVFDASGNLAGIALRHGDGRAVMLPVTMWPSLADAPEPRALPP